MVGAGETEAVPLRAGRRADLQTALARPDAAATAACFSGLVIRRLGRRPEIARAAERGTWTCGALARLADADVAALQLRVVQRRDGALGFLFRVHLDETEAARPTGHPVAHDRGRITRSGPRKHLLQVLIGRVVGKVA